PFPPTTGSPGPPGAGALPTTGSHLPPGGGALPTTGHHLPAAGSALPTTGHHLPPGQVPTVPPSAPGAHAPGRAATVPPSPSRARRSLLISGAVAAVAATGTALAVYLSIEPPATPEATPQSTAATATGTARSQPPSSSAIDEQDIAALAPKRVEVTADQGALVELRWTLPADARRYPVVVQRSPVKQGEQAITALGQGATSTRVAGLDPDSGYCFLVGVPLRISENSTVAWSKPACIRGAVARSAQ
ncbi:hypothetical protein ACTWPW_62175, partial [Nonomuraea sp. KM90]